MAQWKRTGLITQWSGDRNPILLYHFLFYSYSPMARWSNGKTSDSRSEHSRFESWLGQMFLFSFSGKRMLFPQSIVSIDSHYFAYLSQGLGNIRRPLRVRKHVHLHDLSYLSLEYYSLTFFKCVTRTFFFFFFFFLLLLNKYYSHFTLMVGFCRKGASYFY